MKKKTAEAQRTGSLQKFEWTCTPSANSASLRLALRIACNARLTDHSWNERRQSLRQAKLLVGNLCFPGFGGLFGHRFGRCLAGLVV